MLALGALFSLVLLSQTSLNAQVATYKILPPSSELSLEPGKTGSVPITVSNDSSSKQDFAVSFENFTSDDETGAPRLVTGEDFPHGLKDWMSGTPTLSLNGKASRQYTVIIRVPKEIPAGTYYGLVKFTDKSSKLNSSTASLVFVNIGTITETLSLDTFELGQVSYAANGTTTHNFNVKLKNTGTGYTKPDIKIAILKNNTQVKELTLAEGEGGILPQTTRLYNLQYVGEMSLADIYKANLSVVTPGSNLTAELTFRTPVWPTSNSKGGGIRLVWMLLAGVIILVVGAMVIVYRKKLLRFLSREKRTVPKANPATLVTPAEQDGARNVDDTTEINSEERDVLKPD